METLTEQFLHQFLLKCLQSILKNLRNGSELLRKIDMQLEMNIITKEEYEQKVKEVLEG